MENCSKGEWEQRLATILGLSMIVGCRAVGCSTWSSAVQPMSTNNCVGGGRYSRQHVRGSRAMMTGAGYRRFWAVGRSVSAQARQGTARQSSVAPCVHFA